LPATLSRAVALIEPEGRLLILGGLRDGDQSTNAVLQIVPATGAVTVVGRLATAVHDAAGAVLDGVPTLFGGGNSSETGAIQQDGSVVGSLPGPRSDAVAVSLDGNVVIVGGFDGTRSLTAVLTVTDPTIVTPLANLPIAVRYPAVAVTGTGAAQRILVIGGESGGVATDVVQQIDPATGTATIVGHLPYPRTQASALVLGGQLLVVGGESSGLSGAHVFSDILRWQPLSARFTEAGTLPYPVADAAPAVVGCTGYLVGGETPSRVATTITVSAAC
jgi:hypothetical protein